MPQWEFKVMQVGMNDGPDKFNSASRDGWEVVTAQFIPSGDAVGRIGIFALLKHEIKPEPAGKTSFVNPVIASPTRG